jgi:hypothetical protein
MLQRLEKSVKQEIEVMVMKIYISLNINNKQELNLQHSVKHG